MCPLLWVHYICRITDGEIVSCDVFDAEIEEDGSISIFTIDGEHDYRFEVSSNENSSLSLITSQNDVEGNEISRIVYEDIEIEAGDTLSGDVFSETLTNSGNEKTDTIEGKVVSNEEMSSYNISVLTEGSGNVNNVAAASYGDEITLTASPIMNAEFKGWYNQKTGAFISKDKSLSVIVKSDVNLTAKFEYLPVTFSSSKSFHLIDGKLTGSIYVIKGTDTEGTVSLSVLDSKNQVIYKEDAAVKISENNSYSVSYSIDLSDYCDIEKIRAEFYEGSEKKAEYEKEVEKAASHNYTEESYGADENRGAYTYFVCEDCGYTSMSTESYSIGHLESGEDGVSARIWNSGVCTVLASGYDEKGRMIWRSIKNNVKGEDGNEIIFSCSAEEMSKISKYKLFLLNGNDFSPLCEYKVE